MITVSSGTYYDPPNYNCEVTTTTTTTDNYNGVMVFYITYNHISDPDPFLEIEYEKSLSYRFSHKDTFKLKPNLNQISHRRVWNMNGRIGIV